MLRTSIALSLAFFLWCSNASLQAQQSVEVSGVKYPTSIQQSIQSQNHTLVLTGTGIRKKLVFNVYTIASYIDAPAKVRTAEELASVDAIRQLHLVMKRELSGEQLADAFQEAIRKNYPAPAFEAELQTLTTRMKAVPSVKEGHHVRLMHLPGVGFYGDLGGDHQLLIKNPAFSRAVWDIYLGKNNVDADIKAGLISYLK